MFILTAIPSSAAVTLNVSCSTSTYNGDESPKNIAVMWITNQDASVDIRTIGRWANVRKRWLSTWVSQTDSVLDGTTGATRNNHNGRISATWNLQNRSNETVPNGTYRYYIEMTEEHCQGALGYGTITIGNHDTTITGLTYMNNAAIDNGGAVIGVRFHDMRAVLSGTIRVETKLPLLKAEFSVNPNPFSRLVHFSGMNGESNGTEISIFNLDGRLVKRINKSVWDGCDDKGFKLPEGVYIAQTLFNGKAKTARLTLLR